MFLSKSLLIRGSGDFMGPAPSLPYDLRASINYSTYVVLVPHLTTIGYPPLSRLAPRAERPASDLHLGCRGPGVAPAAQPKADRCGSPPHWLPASTAALVALCLDRSPPLASHNRNNIGTVKVRPRDPTAMAS